MLRVLLSASAIALTAVTTYALAWAAMLRCSGDTDVVIGAVVLVVVYSVLDRMLPH